VAYGQLVGRLCDILQRDIGLSFPDHEVYDYQRLEDDGPGGISESMGHRPKDLGDAGLSGMSRDENVLDIFGLGCRELLHAG
jgi:hypothetical protein